MLRFPKEAIPLELVAWVVVPDRVPLPGLVEMAMVTLVLGTLLPKASCTFTVTAGLIAAAAVVLLGPWTNVADAGAAAWTMTEVKPVIVFVTLSVAKMVFDPAVLSVTRPLNTPLSPAENA